MNATELIDCFIAKLPDWRGSTLASIRNIIHEADPAVLEEWKWMGAPVWSHDGILCVAGAFKDKVKITFYNGASIPDPDKLFNNGLEGNKWRAIDLYKGDKINNKALGNLVLSAVAYNQSNLKSTKKTSGNAPKKSAK